MRAVQMFGWQTPPELRDVPEPEPGPGEVLLRVTGAGLCHSDLHLMHWPAGTVPYQLPFTLGHEIAGTVAAVGDGVDGVEVGESVIVYGPWGCGRCPRCSRGEEHLCERRDIARGTAPGIGRDGGLAEYWSSRRRDSPCPIGDLDPVAAAPLADAALTPYHAIKRALPGLPPGSAALVIGVGGLGHVAVQILRALSGVPGRRRRPPRGGARPGDGGRRRRRAAVGRADRRDVRRAAGGRGAALVIDCVGIDATLALAAASVAPGGHLAVLGVGGGTLPVPLRRRPVRDAGRLLQLGHARRARRGRRPGPGRCDPHRDRARGARGGTRRVRPARGRRGPWPSGRRPVTASS